METHQVNKWHRRFLGLAFHVAEWSKDPSTKVGAVIADCDGKRIVSMGFNGLPQHIDQEDVFLGDREVKLAMTVHAEKNAILFAQRNLDGCSIYCTHIPCASCAALITQAGIIDVHAIEPTTEFLERWAESFALSRKLFEAAGVTLTLHKQGQGT